MKKNQWLLKNDVTFNRGQKMRNDTSDNRSLRENLRELGASTIDEGLLYSAVRTRPNRRMLFPKTYLHLYNTGVSIQKQVDFLRWVNVQDTFSRKKKLELRRYVWPPLRAWSFLFPRSRLPDSVATFLTRTAGEPPALIDSTRLEADVNNLKTVYFSRGFFNTEIEYAVDTCTWRINRQKARVTYHVDEGAAAVIDRIYFDIADPYMDSLVQASMSESRLDTGAAYNEDNFVAERNRIATLLRNKGYYTFSTRNITYDVDTKPPKDSILNNMPRNPAL
ncbi:MAG: POTRA domain-containing protein, partial [Bacteroidota bacterium]